MARVRGGSGWGAGTFAGGDGSRQPSETELEYAEFQTACGAGSCTVAAAWQPPVATQQQGAYFAKVAKKLAG
ncbi:hypothetical protein COCSUDRAFT_58333 [Coccomyxa subellipsoidea C-169]|uniref:Uncharacterized protein n=1 Tax=Coccomyxa subellipsoidea (strain C-169) TaxID=574566 RepID=I0YMG5_COCSC|nr:hypothetical protein COCSUDRAFT_58333 [Coccomyxa subellipsoidea C-169]EIE19584.1 hypothetical protein COCSUDRAFT_58333 [Coccomyxa subellipsoidea C-169]|eukprot:XP_005644128.1 hypothetical protein COCSUDRAFT_58333 [Coccomyxa subellipsoidea C-169]